MERTIIPGNRSPSRRASSLLLTTIIAILFVAASWPLGRAEARQDITDWPYRYTVTGPASGIPGAELAYVVSYELVDPASTYGPVFIFIWPAEAASLSSYEAIAGPSGVIHIPDDHSVRVDFSETPPAGAFEFILLVEPAFTGVLEARISLPGTGIILPDGSVASVSTSISAGGSLPGTGSGADLEPGAHASPLARLAGALASGGAVLAASALWFARSRRARSGLR